MAPSPPPPPPRLPPAPGSSALKKNSTLVSPSPSHLPPSSSGGVVHPSASDSYHIVVGPQNPPSHPPSERDIYVSSAYHSKGHSSSSSPSIFCCGRRWAVPSCLHSLFSSIFTSIEDTPAITTAKTQARPCHANRFLLLALYFVYALLTARVYFAWPNLSNLLFRNDAYIWLCDSQDDPSQPDYQKDLRLPENGGKRYKCEAQNSEVGKLFVTCLAFAFSCSLLAGVLLDCVGPKITAIIGQACNGLAWILLAFAGKGCETYFPGFILMGVGSDIGYLPLLSAANLFPGHEGLIISLLGAAKSASFAMPTILDVVEAGSSSIHLKEAALGYAVFGPGVCLLMSLVLVPLSRYKPWNEFSYLDAEDQPHPLVRVNDSFASYGAHAWRDSFSSFQEVKDWIHQHHLNTPLEEITTAGGGGGGGVCTAHSHNSSGSLHAQTSGGYHPPQHQHLTTTGTTTTTTTTTVGGGATNLHGISPISCITSVSGGGAPGGVFASSSSSQGRIGDPSSSRDQHGDTAPRGEGKDGLGFKEDEDEKASMYRSVPLEKGASAETVATTQVQPSCSGTLISQGATDQQRFAMSSSPAPPTTTDASPIHTTGGGGGVSEGHAAAGGGVLPSIPGSLAGSSSSFSRRGILGGGDEPAGISPGRTERLPGGGGDEPLNGVDTPEKNKHNSNSNYQAGGEDVLVLPMDEGEKPVGFWRQFFSKYSLGIVIYSVLKAIMYAFFTTGGENLLGKQVNDFMGAALPFSCIPCLALGKVVDSFGIMPVLLVLNSFITLAYAFSLIHSLGAAYISAILYICYVSFYSSQSYCYVSDTFSANHFGKLVGIIHMIAGFLSLLKIPMQTLVVHVFDSKYLYPCLIMLGFCTVNFLILGYLVYLKRKVPHPFWPKAACEAVEKEQERKKQHKQQMKEMKRKEKAEKKKRGRGGGGGKEEEEGKTPGKGLQEPPTFEMREGGGGGQREETSPQTVGKDGVRLHSEV